MVQNQNQRTITINQSNLELVQGDITQQVVDALVTAANSGLRGGGGVDGAIHRVGGPSILEACRRIGSCPTGEARITGAGNLSARFVIHAVGPVYETYDNPDKAAALLAGAYRNSLALAAEHQVRSIAFPSISTGIYGYPVEPAAEVALSTVATFLREQPVPDPTITLVRFVLFDAHTFAAYQRAAETLEEQT